MLSMEPVMMLKKVTRMMSPIVQYLAILKMRICSLEIKTTNLRKMTKSYSISKIGIPVA